MALARVSRSGVPIEVDTAQLSALARELRRAAPEVWIQARVEIRECGEIVAEDWRKRSSRWSSRMPKTIRTKNARAGMVKIVGGGARFPGAAAIEHKGRPGTFRAPLFGDRNAWYDHEAHPDGAEALAANTELILVKIGDALQRAVTRAIAANR